MRRNVLFSLCIVVSMLAIYYRPPSVMAAAAKDQCPCEEGLGADLATLISDGITASGGPASSCQIIHFPGGQVNVLVTPSQGIPATMEASAFKDSGSLGCFINILQTNASSITAVGLSMGQFNSCKRSIRQLCGDIANLGLLQ